MPPMTPTAASISGSTARSAAPTTDPWPITTMAPAATERPSSTRSRASASTATGAPRPRRSISTRLCSGTRTRRDTRTGAWVRRRDDCRRARPSRISGVRCFHSLEFRQHRHFSKVLGAEPRPVNAHRCGAGTLDADRLGWRGDHAERLIGGIAGHGVDDLKIVHSRGDRHRRVTELAQDGEFQVAVAFALATAPTIARDRDRAADDGVEPRHVREGYLLRPAVAVRQAHGLFDLVGRNTARIQLLEAAAQSGRRYENGDAAAERLGAQRAL